MEETEIVPEEKTWENKVEDIPKDNKDNQTIKTIKLEED